jgi:hypothetical protein
MKKINLILAGLALIITHILMAQRPFEVFADSFVLSLKNYHGFQIKIPETPINQVKESWVSSLEKGTKSKVVEASEGEISIFGTFIKDISPDPVNVYSQLNHSDSTLKMFVSVELRRDLFITEDSTPTEFGQLKTYLKNFARDEYAATVKGQQKTEEKILDARKWELKDLQNEKDDLEKKIDNNNKDILKSNENIIGLNSQLTLQNNDLENTKVTLTVANSDELKKTIEDRIKEIEKERGKTMNSIEKEKSDIASCESKISNLKSDIKTNEKQQKLKENEVDLQKKVYDRVSDKLKTIESW